MGRGAFRLHQDSDHLRPRTLGMGMGMGTGTGTGMLHMLRMLGQGQGQVSLATSRSSSGDALYSSTVPICHRESIYYGKHAYRIEIAPRSGNGDGICE